MTNDLPNAAPVADQLQTEEMLRRGLDILSKRRWWFILATAIVLVGAIVFVRHQKPIFKATGMLHIDAQPPKLLSEVSEIVQLGATGYGSSIRAYYAAQLQIMQSRSVASIVATRLHLQSDPKFLGIDDPEKRLTKVQQNLIMTNADVVGILASRVLVELSEDSMIAKVSIEDANPQMAATLVNAVMQAYKERNMQQKRATVQTAFQDLRGLREKMETERRSTQENLYKFEKEHDLSDNRRLAVNERILALNRDLREVHAARLRASQEVAQLKKYRNSKDIFSASAPGLMRDSLVSDLKRRWLDVDVRRREVETVYLENHPKVQMLQHQMDQLVTLGGKHVAAMYDAASQTLQTATVEESDLIAQLAKSKAEDAEIRQTKIDYDRLKDKADEVRSFYDKVAKRFAETDLTKEVGFNNVSVLDPAVVPVVPVRPNVQLNLLIGVLLSLIIGVAVAVAVEMLDNTIKDRLDIEQVLQVPYLGSIPTFSPSNQTDGLAVPDGKLDLYVHYRPNSRVAEAARSLRTNLLFMRPDKALRSILVTSGQPREGKTSTSTTLAITLAASTGSTILVDTDLRKPRLHRVFGVPSDGGVTGYIVGHDTIDKFTKKTDIPGLDILPCGALPPNPSEILHTERFRQMIVELTQHYECVVFDSPPIEIVSDALVMATLVDGVILVAQAERSRRDSVGQTVAALRAVNGNLLGIALSRTQTRGTGYGYYYRGRGYRREAAYRYRYAADAEKD